MRRSISRLFIGLLAAPLMLASSAAMAAPSADACNNIQLAATGQCDFEVSGGCEALCTPLSFTAACDGQCTASASVDCTGSCGIDCEAKCMVNPGSFDCTGTCEADCNARCTEGCTDAGCQATCSASCSHRCDIQCTATPPSADCTAKCEASCGASCEVQANIDCSLSCSVDLEGGCKVKCTEPQGALFCDGQYVNVVGSVDDCLAYLASQGLTVSATGTCDASGCEGSVSVGCSAAPYVGSVDNRWGVGAIAGLMMGLGMVVSRRRRRA